MTRVERDIDLLTRKLGNYTNYPWYTKDDCINSWKAELREKLKVVLENKGSYCSRQYYKLLSSCIYMIPYLSENKDPDLGRSVCDMMQHVYKLSVYTHGIIFNKIKGKEIECVLETCLIIIKRYKELADYVDSDIKDEESIENEAMKFINRITDLFVGKKIWKDLLYMMIEENKNEETI